MIQNCTQLTYYVNVHIWRQCDFFLKIFHEILRNQIYTEEIETKNKDILTTKYVTNRSPTPCNASCQFYHSQHDKIFVDNAENNR
jgi:hypothetical protein